MIPQALLLLAIALGQLCLAILVVNVSHGFAYPGRWVERVWAAIDYLVLVVLAGLALATLAAAWWLGPRPWDQWPWPLRAYALACLAASLIALPATTLARLVRRRPRGISGRSEQ